MTTIYMGDGTKHQSGMKMTRSEMVEALVDREMDNIFEAGVEEFVRNVLIHGCSRMPFSKMTDVEICEAWDDAFGEG